MLKAVQSGIGAQQLCSTASGHDLSCPECALEPFWPYCMPWIPCVSLLVLLCKVVGFVDFLKGRFKSLFQPRQHIAIDERMAKSWHRSGIRQYIRVKPTKWGLKYWVLADSSNAYVVDFNIYSWRAEWV